MIKKNCLVCKKEFQVFGKREKTAYNLMAFTGNGHHMAFERGFNIKPESIIFDGRNNETQSTP